MFLAFLFASVTRCEAMTQSTTRWRPSGQRTYWAQQRLQEQQLAIEYAAVNTLFQKKLNKKERRFLNQLCWAEYAFNYYNTLLGFAHYAVEVEHLKKEAEETRRTLKRSRVYLSILRKAEGKTKEYLLNYIMYRAEAGKNDAWKRNARNSATEQLQRNDLFYFDGGKMTYHIEESIKSNIGILFTVSIALVILGLIGSLCLPKKPVFRTIRTVLEH